MCLDVYMMGMRVGLCCSRICKDLNIIRLIVGHFAGWWKLKKVLERGIYMPRCGRKDLNDVR